MNHLDPDMDLPSDAGASRDAGNDASGFSGVPDDGRRRIGRFVIDFVIGRGGMGEVFKAFDPVNDRIVALKVLDVKGYDDADTLKRFRREADSALALDHINIARMYGTDTDQQGRPIISMEYIEGRGLDLLVEDEPDLPYSQLLDYVIQTARGLDSAFRRSIIHRDIKPENLIVTAENQIKIIDFGLAKSMWDNNSVTGAGLVVGTPRYISPEQGMGRNVDHRSDIYSLGATLYELVTGKCPFDGDTPLAIMMKHINSPLMPPYMVNPRVPADISDIITTMMAKDPSERFQDYESLIRALESAKIHRLAKERRSSGDLSGMQTVMIPEPGTEEEFRRGGTGSYLTEGLVNIELPPDDAPPPSKAKLVLLSLAGLAVLAFCTLFIMKPTQTEAGAGSSLGQKIGAFFSRASKSIDPAPTKAQIIEEDRERINLTRSRMEAVVSRLLRLRAESNESGIPTIGALRADGTFTEEQTQDAWGNDFYITDSSGGGTLIASGRDNRDRTADDFRLSLDGSEQKIPEVIQSEAIGK